MGMTLPMGPENPRASVSFTQASWYQLVVDDAWEDQRKEIGQELGQDISLAPCLPSFLS